MLLLSSSSSLLLLLSSSSLHVVVVVAAAVAVVVKKPCQKTVNQYLWRFITRSSRSSHIDMYELMYSKCIFLLPNMILSQHGGL